MKKGRRYNREEIEVIAKGSIGKTFRELRDKELVNVTPEALKKGGLGQLVEMALYGIESNNESEPDFMPSGVELKVTPYKKLKDGRLSAKERLVLNIIDYMTEFANDFKASHFWFKNSKIQLLWYLHEENKDKLDFVITNEKFLELEMNEDLKQIEKDWETVINKIKEGKAHEISEGDTMYLGACTKGTNASSTRKQPFSDIPAMQRAFCFKTSYMTQLVRKYIGDYSDVEKLLSNTDLSFNDYIDSITKKYIGESESQLLSEFMINIKAKDKYSLIVNRMFNIKKGLKDTDEFLKANIIPKTIRVEENGKIIESISFPIFRFKEIVNENWESCELKEELETTKYMFFIFKKEHKEYIFKGVKLWNMPQIIIDNEAKNCWEKTVYKIKNGIKFNIVGNVVYNDLPGLSDNGIIHVRPHTSKSAYKLNSGFEKGDIKKHADQLPNGEWMTKQCFWFNNTYIEGIIKDV